MKEVRKLKLSDWFLFGAIALILSFYVHLCFLGYNLQAIKDGASLFILTDATIYQHFFPLAIIATLLDVRFNPTYVIITILNHFPLNFAFALLLLSLAKVFDQQSKTTDILVKTFSWLFVGAILAIIIITIIFISAFFATTTLLVVRQIQLVALLSFGFSGLAIIFIVFNVAIYLKNRSHV